MDEPPRSLTCGACFRGHCAKFEQQLADDSGWCPADANDPCRVQVDYDVGATLSSRACGSKQVGNMSLFAPAGTICAVNFTNGTRLQSVCDAAGGVIIHSSNAFTPGRMTRSHPPARDNFFCKPP